MRSPADAAPGWVVIASIPAPGGEVLLDADESHYASRVVRARVDDRLTATDGCGHVARLRVVSLGARVVARVESREHRERPRALVVASGAPEGERVDWLVEKLAELGAARWVPLACERNDWERFPKRRERLQRLARAALRQSQQPYGMLLGEPITVGAWCAALAQPPGRRWLADPGGEPASGVPAPLDGTCTLAIGPSSGFSDGERSALQDNGFVALSLAGGRLRTETAALAAAAWWAAAARPSLPPAADPPAGR